MARTVKTEKSKREREELEKKIEAELLDFKRAASRIMVSRNKVDNPLRFAESPFSPVFCKTSTDMDDVQPEKIVFDTSTPVVLEKTPQRVVIDLTKDDDEDN